MSVVMFFMPTGQQASGAHGTYTGSPLHGLQLTACRRSTVEGHPRLWAIAQGRAEAVPGPFVHLPFIGSQIKALGRWRQLPCSEMLIWATTRRRCAVWHRLFLQVQILR